MEPALKAIKLSGSGSFEFSNQNTKTSGNNIYIDILANNGNKPNVQYVSLNKDSIDSGLVYEKNLPFKFSLSGLKNPKSDVLKLNLFGIEPLKAITPSQFILGSEDSFKFEMTGINENPIEINYKEKNINELDIEDKKIKEQYVGNDRERLGSYRMIEISLKQQKPSLTVYQFSEDSVKKPMAITGTK